MVVTVVLKNQILGKGGAEVNKDLLKTVPFSFKKGYYQIPKLGGLAILEKINRGNPPFQRS